MKFFRVIDRYEWLFVVSGAFFLVVGLGHFLGSAFAQSLARYTTYWWPYEFLGTFYLMVYLAFMEGPLGRHPGVVGRLGLMLILFATVTVGLHLAFPRLPFSGLFTASLLVLLSYIPILVIAEDENRRKQFLMVGGRSFCLLIITFFGIVVLASLCEKWAVKNVGRNVFETTVVLLWGALYNFSRVLVETGARRLKHK